MADLFTDRLVGWRCWKVLPDADELTALYQNYVWPIDAAEATHMFHQHAMFGKGAPDPHDVPAAGHPCGLHGYGDLAVALDKQKQGSRPEYSFVYGAIVAWGRIVVHERGFRAQRAKVVCLLEQTDPLLSKPPYQTSPTQSVAALSVDVWAQRARKVAERYGVPLLPPDLAAEYAAGEGAPLSDYRQ